MTIGKPADHSGDCIPGANFQLWESFGEGVFRVSGSDFCVNSPEGEFE